MLPPFYRRAHGGSERVSDQVTVPSNGRVQMRVSMANATEPAGHADGWRTQGPEHWTWCGGRLCAQPKKISLRPVSWFCGRTHAAPTFVFLKSEIQNLVYWAKYMKSLVFNYFYLHRNFNLNFPRF